MKKIIILLYVIGMFALIACQNSTSTVTSTPVPDNVVPPKGTTIEENKVATDLVITGGSAGVYLINNGRNYGIICPYCKHDIGAIGTSDLHYTISQHKSGETETIQGLKGCPSFRGCGKHIRYTVNVKYTD